MHYEFKIGDLVVHPDTEEPATITDIVDDLGYDAVFYELDEGDMLFGPDLLKLIVRH